jgi:hypothetical protein
MGQFLSSTEWKNARKKLKVKPHGMKGGSSIDTEIHSLLPTIFHYHKHTLNTGVLQVRRAAYRSTGWLESESENVVHNYDALHRSITLRKILFLLPTYYGRR